MRQRTAAWTLILTTFIMWMGSRATSIALPLVALAQTGHEWTTGLVLGAEAIPLLTVPWWGDRWRERMTSGVAVGGVLAVEAGGLAVVPVAAWAGQLGTTTLCLCGLVVGAASALEGPAIRSLLADLGDRVGPDQAARNLAWQDLAHRAPMFLAPPLGALAVGHGHTVALLWSECLAVAFAAALTVSVPSPDRVSLTMNGPLRSGAPPAAKISTALRAYPRLAASIAVHGTCSLTWFAFSLGLAILGAQTARPGVLIAAGMTGYGLASTAVSSAAPALVTRLPAWPTSVAPMVVLGATFLALPHVTASVPAVAILAAIGGAAVPVGIAAHNRLLSSEAAAGPLRRAAFTADTIVDGAGSAAGMLSGGAVIGLLGVATTLAWAGVLVIAATLVALVSVGVGPRLPPRVQRPTPGGCDGGAATGTQDSTTKAYVAEPVRLPPLDSADARKCTSAAPRSRPCRTRARQHP